MIRLQWFLPLLVVLSGTALGDSWGRPQEKDYFCESKRFVAHVTPPKGPKKAKPLLEVLEINNEQRLPLWQCKLGNEKAPMEVYLSDDGRHVATINEHGRIGYGNFVLAFYDKTGLVRNYSLVEMPHIPKDIDKMGLRQLIPHSVSSRWWNENSIQFFQTYKSDLHFCMWWPLFDRWIAWNPTDGEECVIKEDMIEGLNDKGRVWSLNQLNSKYPPTASYEFLSQLKRPEDRHYIEAMLSSTAYTSGGARSRSFRPKSSGSNDNYRFDEILDYKASSSQRRLAERLLAKWDETPSKMLTPTEIIDNASLLKRDSSQRTHRYLGAVKGGLKLPKARNAEDILELDGVISIYLVPDGTPKSKWYEGPIIHRLRADFNNNYEWAPRHVLLTENFAFNLQTVTPGKYWIKAVWDKTRPSNYYSGKPGIIGSPQKRDYQSLSSPTITVTAGETVDDIVIDCTHQEQ